MRNHTGVFAALAIILATTALAGAKAQTPALGAASPPTISPEDMHRQIDAGRLPITIIDEPY